MALFKVCFARVDVAGFFHLDLADFLLKLLSLILAALQGRARFVIKLVELHLAALHFLHYNRDRLGLVFDFHMEHTVLLQHEELFEH